MDSENTADHGRNNLVIVNDPPYRIKKKKERLLVQKGIENILLRIDDIAFFYTENKVVYVVDQLDKKYLICTNLCELEEDIDPMVFFRANRQYIININFIKSYRAYEKVKIKVDMTSGSNHWIIISQETAPDFRKWIYEA